MNELKMPALQACLSAVIACSAFGQTYTINTLAGGALPVDIVGTSASLIGIPDSSSIPGIAADPNGNLFIINVNIVLRWDAITGVLTRVAGNGSPGFSGDNGPATSAQLASPNGVAVDSSGNVYIADTGNQRVRMVSGGVITTVAGGGSLLGDNGLATSARLYTPIGVALDSSGNLYILDPAQSRVRMVSNGVITTVAGNGSQGFSGDNGPATSAQLAPSAIAVDSAGSLYIADLGNYRVRKVFGGVITTVAGNGTSGFSGDNGPATSAEFSAPSGLSVDTFGNLYVVDSGRVRKVSNGVITTVAGTGSSCCYGRDGGPATSAALLPSTVTADSLGNLYIGDDASYRVLKVWNGVITTVAGGGTMIGDNGPAASAQLNAPSGVAVDSLGDVFVADQVNNRVRKVSNGIITTVAGTGPTGLVGGYGGDDGLATNAQLNQPLGVAVGASGSLYIADFKNFRVRKVSNGVITTVAGSGACCYDGDNGPATSAAIYPWGVTVDAGDNLFIADWQDNVVRKVSNGVITTVAGNGSRGFSGDNGPATSAKLNHPAGVAVDSLGNLFIADQGNSRIRMVSGGVITTVAGDGTYGFRVGPATKAEVTTPSSVATNSSGNVYIVDCCTITMVSGGVLTRVAGNGAAGFSGDNGPAINAQFLHPTGIAVDSSGNIYVVDSYNNRVRVLTPRTRRKRSPPAVGGQ